MGQELLLEIGTEEIPAAFLPQARRDLEAMFRKELAAAAISHGETITMATPRRLLLSISEVAEKQEDCVMEKLGPAKRVAFAADGQPTPAAMGFARSQGVDVACLETAATDKGEYLAVRKKMAGEATGKLLQQMIPNIITNIPFRKSMRWADYELRFARPIHWLLAVFGGQIIPFTLENIESGNRSWGHRFMAPTFFKAENKEDYLTQSRERFVIADPEERRRMILADAESEAGALGGKAFYDEALLDQVTYIVEYPTVISGSFDESYLALPKEVLMTAMMTQQKYFPVIDGQGKLKAHFLTVSNTRPRDPAVVRKGNERVLRARLADARFFFEEDRKIDLEDRLEALKGMIFHTLLGTAYEKVLRFRSLAVELAALLNPDLTETVFRVATLAKADLSTQMVGEFPELQGIMGREYALLAGEAPLIAKGIFEHYLPTGANGALPETEAGSIVSMADKMDSIAGFFGVNLLPSGTADPYALRRQSLGIINIILANDFVLPLDSLVEKSLLILGDCLKRPVAEVKTDILAFFRSRFENLMLAQGRAYDVVAAVLATPSTDLVRMVAKIEALESFKTDANFEPLVIAFKRAGNISKDFPGADVDPALFENDAERNLHLAYLSVKEKASFLIDTGNYRTALEEVARLREPVDAFFNSVLVMAEQEEVKRNRLAILKCITELFHGVADFSKLNTA